MIVLSGTIGAGKTSLAEMLGKHLNSQVFYESVDDNPILPLFYKNPQKYAFLLQVYFLNKRLGDIKQAQNNKLDVIDRSIFEDSLLFKLNADLGRATQTEVDIYRSLLLNMMEKLNDMPSKDPDLLIHVKVSFETMLERIKKRGRDFEQIDNDPALYEYYQELNKRYTDWYSKYDRGPKMEIDGDKFDFVESKQASNDVIEQIDSELKNLNLI